MPSKCFRSAGNCRSSLYAVASAHYMAESTTISTAPDPGPHTNLGPVCTVLSLSFLIVRNDHYTCSDVTRSQSLELEYSLLRSTRCLNVKWKTYSGCTQISSWNH